MNYRSTLEREFHPLREFERIVDSSGPTA